MNAGKLSAALFLALFSLKMFCYPPPGWHTAPDKWKEPRTYHTAFDAKYADRIKISRIAPGKEYFENVGISKKLSPNEAYWYAVLLPDTMKKGPWSASILIFNERDYIIKIDLIDYDAAYMTTVNWINEKLLYVQFWPGRVLGICFIFDVEAEKIIYREMVNDGAIPFQQWRDSKEMNSR